MSKQFIECTPRPLHVPFSFPGFERSNKKIQRRRRRSGWSGLGRTTFQRVVGLDGNLGGAWERTTRTYKQTIFVSHHKAETRCADPNQPSLPEITIIPFV